MIDRLARTDLTAALQQLATGQITNDEFEDGLGSHVAGSTDAGVRAIYDAAWRLYDDGREYRLAGPDALDPETLAAVYRWTGFLASDLEYEWRELPPLIGWLLVLPNVVSLGLLGRLIWRYTARQGDASVWPFIRKSDAGSR